MKRGFFPRNFKTILMCICIHLQLNLFFLLFFISLFLTFLPLIVWKWISHILSTTSSDSNVTNPKPRCRFVCWSISITASSTYTQRTSQKRMIIITVISSINTKIPQGMNHDQKIPKESKWCWQRWYVSSRNSNNNSNKFFYYCS